MATDNMWFKGTIHGEMPFEGEAGKTYQVPVRLEFLDNGALSVTLGDQVFTPSDADLVLLGEWADKVGKAMGLPDENVFVGAYQGRIAK